MEYLQKKAANFPAKDQFQYLQFSEDKYCMSRVKWKMCVCDGCKCNTLANVKVKHVMEDMEDEPASKKLYAGDGRCGEWFTIADQAIRTYTASVRGKIAAEKTACCSEWKAKPGGQGFNKANDDKCHNEPKHGNKRWPGPPKVMEKLRDSRSWKVPETGKLFVTGVDHCPSMYQPISVRTCAKDLCGNDQFPACSSIAGRGSGGT